MKQPKRVRTCSTAGVLFVDEVIVKGKLGRGKQRPNYRKP